MTLTRNKLERFVEVRNASEFNTNIQFQLDASSCGFKIADLGDVTKLDDDRYGHVYVWQTPFGELVEAGGKLSLTQTAVGA